MKNMLIYQSTEYDCGPITLTNAIRYLFEREEIYPDIVKYIMLYCLDSYDEKGEIGKHGTSATAMMFLSNWLNQFGKMKSFSISSTFLSKEEVTLTPNSRIISALQEGGAVLLRVYLDVGHYILLTGLNGDSAYVFDPYYEELDAPDLSREYFDEGISFITDQPKRANRLISLKRLSSQNTGFYEMGPVCDHEAVILFNTATRQTAERTIEYMI